MTTATVTTRTGIFKLSNAFMFGINHIIGTLANGDELRYAIQDGDQIVFAEVCEYREDNPTVCTTHKVDTARWEHTNH